ncbi:MAG: RsmB/NOP family class I SAM-dependent RNA methyltransferase [Desulfohalobiaceae bacterium]|nr:RsmB/NOP family class I SAM-dependent RNA methyltransferase [Desulfohalobiaceae bacterium]
MKGSDTEHLLRYADLVEDMSAFLEAASRPLPRVVWPNPLKADPQEITELILVRCPRARPLSWPPGACLVPAEENPGKWPEFHLGLIHCQEEVTLYPVFAMAPRPGEAILDMCAAPGNKTVRIGLATKDAARIVANDLSWQRLRALRDMNDRLGLTCIGVRRGNGLHIPGEERFDRVLLDAPCTGEGTSRKSQGWIRHQKKGDWNKLSGLQRGLLRRALNLTQPGGLVIYCTCTFAPEENEWVLSGIYESVARMEPLELPEGVRTTPGVTDWKGMRFRADVVHASRFWPHQNNTGGFFLAALRKL